MLKNGTVGAVISLGPERHKVPDVRNKTLDDAQQALDESKLAYGDEVERYDEKIAKGRVITTDPEPGTSLRRNSAVDVVVSKGPRPIKIPDFTGKPAAPAEKALDKRGFKVDDDRGQRRHRPQGPRHLAEPRLGHRPEGRRDLARRLQGAGDGRGAQRRRQWAGRRRTARLEAAGFQVEVRHSSIYIGVQYVVSTDPGRGTDGAQGQHGHRQHRLRPARHTEPHFRHSSHTGNVDGCPCPSPTEDRVNLPHPRLAARLAGLVTGSRPLRRSCPAAAEAGARGRATPTARSCGTCAAR